MTIATRTLRSSTLLSWRGALLALIPIGCAVLYARDPADGGIYPPCPFRTLTGLDCPGCGTGRALHRIFHGRIDEAFVLNPLATLLLPMLGAVALASLWSTLTDRPLVRVRMPSWTGWAVTAMFLAFWVVRNLPWTPVAWMASYR